MVYDKQIRKKLLWINKFNVTFLYSDKADGSITFQGTYNESLGDLSTQTSIDFQQDFCQVVYSLNATFCSIWNKVKVIIL